MKADPDSDGRSQEGEDSRLEGLPSSLAPPPHLEEQVLARLRERNLLRGAPGQGGNRMRWAVAASIAAAFLLGMGAHEWRDEPAANFVILLDRPSGTTLSIGQTDARIAEYSAWARSLDEDGLLVAAERLLPGSEAFGPQPPGTSPSGFFLIRARDREQARAAAETCPHLRHGGSISLQAIDVSTRSR